MKNQVYLTILLFILFAGYRSENITIKGCITDERGLPVPGVTILVKGTKKGVITDLDGKYTISVAPDAALMITFIGYNTEEIRVDGSTCVIDVQLTPDINSLDEIIIVC